MIHGHSRSLTVQPPLPLTCAAAGLPHVIQALRLVGCTAVPDRRGQTVGPAGRMLCIANRVENSLI